MSVNSTTPFDITDRVAVVTGAASGIGFAVAGCLAAAGARVALLDINPAVEGVARSLPGGPERHVGIAADITAAGVPDALVRRVTETLGPVDILVNNAGVALLENAEALSEEAWDRTMTKFTKYETRSTPETSGARVSIRRAADLLNIRGK